MLVSTNLLVEGCMLSEDVTGYSNHPIMSKKTILTEELINILQGFLISEVHVEKILMDGRKFSPKNHVDQETEGTDKFSDFSVLYLKNVQLYKKLFKNWQAGSKLEVAEIRTLLVPLMGLILEDPAEILMLHHYCSKEEYIYHHSISVGLIAGYLAHKMKCSKADVYQAALGGCLADSGMAKLSEGILLKASSLTAEENDEMQQHPLFSYQMIKDSPLIADVVKLAVLQHHGRMDGTGYPETMRNKKMHLFSKIIAVADVFHAMTSERIYRKKQSPFKVIEMILHDSFGKFDIRVVRTLMEGIANFSVGSNVVLNNGIAAEIIFSDARSQIRPMVKVQGSEQIINLMTSPDLYIEEIV